MKERIEYIDIMKGIAIILVVVGHYITIHLCKTVIWSFHMPLFVFLSGYFFKPDRPNIIRKAAKSYMRPYCIVWGLLIIVEVLMSLLRQRDVADVFILRFVSGIFGVGSNATPFRLDYIIKIGAIWFLYALFVSMIYSRYLFKLRKLTYMIVAYAVLWICMKYLCDRMLVPFGISQGLSFTLWIGIGYYYHKDIEGRISISRSIKIIVPAGWILIVCLEYFNGYQYGICNYDLQLYGLEIIGAILGCFTFKYVSQYLEGSTLRHILSKLGNISLWILCVHAFSIEHPLFPLPQFDYYGIPHCVVDITAAYILHYLYVKYKNRNISPEAVK